MSTAETKPLWKSKTIWLSVFTAVSAFCPPVQAFMLASPEATSMIVGAIFAGLRWATDSKLSIT